MLSPKQMEENKNLVHEAAEALLNKEIIATEKNGKIQYTANVCA